MLSRGAGRYSGPCSDVNSQHEGDVEEPMNDSRHTRCSVRMNYLVCASRLDVSVALPGAWDELMNKCTLLTPGLLGRQLWDPGSS